MAQWPLVGRTEELGRLDRALRAGARAAVIAGPAGVGKTRLGTEVLALAEAGGFHPVRVMATQTCAGLPYGAFATHLPELRADVAPTETLRRVAEAIVGGGDGRRVAILVDDAHLLDVSSAALTHHLAADTSTFVIATVRSSEPASDAIVGLWKDGVAERFDLATFAAAEAQGLLEAALGGPVEPATGRMLWARTEGNALFLHELVLAALEAGSLREDRGTWRLTGPLPPSPRLIELVEARLEGFDDADRRILDALAIAEPIDALVLERHSGAVDLDRFERRGVVRVDEERGRLTVRLGHPLYGDVLRARLSPLRTRDISRSLADALEAAGGGDRERVLRLATWRLAGGGGFDATLMLAGARQAHTRHDLELAERLARAAWEGGGRFEAGQLLAIIVSQVGRADEAESVLGSLVPADDGQRAAVAVSRIQNFLLSRRADLAVACAEEAEATILDPAARAEVGAQRAMVLGFAGRTVESIEVVDAMLPHATGPTLAMLALSGSVFHGSAGRLAKGLELNDLALKTHIELETQLMWPPALHRYVRIDLTSLMGNLREVEVRASRWYADSVDQHAPVEQAYAAATLAKALARRGRVRTAAQWAETAARLWRDNGRPAEVSYALIYLTHPLALAGDGPAAAAALAEYDSLPPAGGGEFGSEVIQARAWTAVALGDMAGGIELMQEAADLTQHQEMWALEALMRHELARLGRAADVAGRLAELAEVVEGPLVGYRAAHAAALAAGDGAGLDAAAAGFDELGAMLLAAEAATDAAVAWRRAGEMRQATASERRAVALVAECDGARTPALATTAVARVELTPRELDVARLAASGLSNKEIAARLFLSIRTVENKLQAAYTKLGIAGRGELPAALEGR